MPARAERFPLSAGGLSAITVVIRLDRGRLTSQESLNAVVAHEFGHALGIGAHSDDARDLMFGLPTVSAPSARDRGTLRFVLGQRPGLTL
jgi:predicted Zn-dependent protease